MNIFDQLMHPNNNRWNLENLNAFFDSYTVNEICKIRIPVNGEDRLIWKLADNGIFAIKSAYKVIDVAESSNSSSDGHPNFPWVQFQKLPLPPKILHFLWKCVHDFLPVRNMIAKHIACANINCPLCNKETETLDQLFLEFEVAKQVWIDIEYPHNRIGT